MEVTYNAIRELKKMFDSESNPLSGIRISVQPGCCVPKPQFTVSEKAIEGDKIVTIEAIPFFIDKSTEKKLSGYIIDFNITGFSLDYMLPPGRCCR